MVFINLISIWTVYQSCCSFFTSSLIDAATLIFAFSAQMSVLVRLFIVLEWFTWITGLHVFLVIIILKATPLFHYAQLCYLWLAPICGDQLNLRKLENVLRALFYFSFHLSILTLFFEVWRSFAVRFPQANGGLKCFCLWLVSFIRFWGCLNRFKIFSGRDYSLEFRKDEVRSKFWLYLH